MTMIDLTPAQAVPRIAALLAAHESRTLEFKRLGDNKVVRKLQEAVCAFANTQGGVLALGVADEKQGSGAARLHGIQENPEALDELQRKLRTQFHPPIDGVRLLRLACTLRDGSAGHVVLVQVPQSDKVHSIIDDGTWTRLDAGNREMTASEISELSYRRGVRSAESEPLPVGLDLLETDAWRRFVAARGFRSGAIADQLYRIGLADKVGDDILPRRAAVLLFADEPGSLLAAHGARADIRLMVYDGTTVGAGPAPNLRKPPKTLRGPLIAGNLREFPEPPNIDAGEGVRMMFAEMEAARLYPPQYRQNTERAVESVTVTLLNHERPTIWDEVSAWIDANGSIANADLCRIARIDTLKASKILRDWVDQGVLVPLPDRGKRNMAYVRSQHAEENADLLSDGFDNNGDKE